MRFSQNSYYSGIQLNFFLIFLLVISPAISCTSELRSAFRWGTALAAVQSLASELTVRKTLSAFRIPHSTFRIPHSTQQLAVGECHDNRNTRAVKGSLVPQVIRDGRICNTRAVKGPLVLLRFAIGRRQSAIGLWRLAIGNWQSAIGNRPLSQLSC